MYQELINIVKVCSFIYQNIRLNENSTAINLPSSKEQMNEEL